jgi:hypothetical protein
MHTQRGCSLIKMKYPGGTNDNTWYENCEAYRFIPETAVMAIDTTRHQLTATGSQMRMFRDCYTCCQRHVKWVRSVVIAVQERLSLPVLTLTLTRDLSR